MLRGSSNFQRTVDSSYLPQKKNLKELAVFMKEPERKNRWFSAQFVFSFSYCFGAPQFRDTKVGCLNSGGPADGCVGGYILYTRFGNRRVSVYCFVSSPDCAHADLSSSFFLCKK